MPTISLPTLLALALTLALPLASSAARISLDLRPPAQTPRATLLSAEPGILRRTTLPPGAASPAPLAVGDVLDLQLYPDVSVSLAITARDPSPLAGNAFHAIVDNSPWRDAVVLETPHGLHVTLASPSSSLVYTIVSSKNGVSVREIDPAAEPLVHLPSLTPPASPKSGFSLLSTSPSPDQPTDVIDVLVAYDTPATAWANANQANITNLAQSCVTRMNSALANNNLSSTFRFRLVGAVSINANASGDLNAALKAARDGSGDWAPVKQFRESFGADVVSVMIDTGSAYDTTGLGYSLSESHLSNIPGFASSAYSAISVRAAAQSNVMTHEIGHNMGAGHSDAQSDSPGPQSYSYSRGFYFTGSDSTAYHTIMAYNSDGYGNSYSPAPLFSDPSAQWAGVTAGDSTHDNAQVLLNTWSAVANFRARTIPLSYDVFFSPAAGSLFSDSLTISLAPGKAGETIRYTTDGSTPTATHGSIYSAPFTITQTTTVKAVVVTDGSPGMVFTAQYFLSDIGAALGAPHLTWTCSDPDNLWTAQSETTFDGSFAVQSPPLPKGTASSTRLTAPITGPTRMSFRYRAKMYSSTFSVLVGGETLWSADGETDEWTLAEVEIPSGTHNVSFQYSQRGYYHDPTFCGVWLDDVRFDAISRSPSVSPATTSRESTATTFRDSLTITLTPTTPGSFILYTLDGSDPNGDTALTYSAPLAITNSTLLRAVECDPGKDPSPELVALYLERHPVSPGEWTDDVEGAKSAAAQSGNLICVLISNLKTSSSSLSFYNVARSKTFLDWAKANGIYLILFDKSIHPYADAARNYFFSLHPYTTYNYTQMYFVKPSNPDTAIANGLGVSGHEIGSVTYNGTAQSLGDGIGSVLSQIGITPSPIVHPTPSEILCTEGIEWTNSSTPPWREEYPNRIRAGGFESVHASTLSARVNGKGKLVFSWQLDSYSWQNTFTFKVDNSQIFKKYYTGATTQSGVYEYNVTSQSGATFTWEYNSADASRDYNICGAWIWDVQWIPEDSQIARTDAHGNTVSIPRAWFVERGLATSSATPAELAAAADADSDNDGICNWHEYVCGTDPLDPSDKLRCLVAVTPSGTIEIDYTPKTGILSGYQPVIQGKTNLADPQWQPQSPTHRFFKVTLQPRADE